ncbi:hypothetical protein BASA82_001091 [Batrachochytrium salamandrivorans]|nr:hypothetical protein BASA82_001091 [Batrachochytrium salamandrivorans]
MRQGCVAADLLTGQTPSSAGGGFDMRNGSDKRKKSGSTASSTRAVVNEVCTSAEQFVHSVLFHAVKDLVFGLEFHNQQLLGSVEVNPSSGAMEIQLERNSEHKFGLFVSLSELVVRLMCDNALSFVTVKLGFKPAATLEAGAVRE